MKKLSKGTVDVVTIHPRWPYRQVYISDAAYEALCQAQSCLAPQRVTIILTRGLENEGMLLARLHAFGRRSGSALFWLLFPRRRSEIPEIFSSNGHTVSGDCVDISIAVKGTRLRLLPFGVFTPQLLIDAIYERHRDTLDMVRATLVACGFALHSNPTEIMQIHCELGHSLGQWRHRA